MARDAAESQKVGQEIRCLDHCAFRIRRHSFVQLWILPWLEPFACDRVCTHEHTKSSYSLDAYDIEIQLIPAALEARCAVQTEEALSVCYAFDNGVANGAQLS